MAHKTLSAVILIAIIGAGYYGYHKAYGATTTTKYVLGTVSRQMIVSTVTGSGQISPSQQVEIKPKASGDVVSVVASAGQYIKAGAVIAYLDSSDAQKTVRDATASLESAQISLDRLKAPVDALTSTQATNNLAKAKDTLQNTQDDLNDSYGSGFDSVSSAFLNFPTVMTGLDSILHASDRTLGGTSVSNIDYYANTIQLYNDQSTKGWQYRDDAESKYTAAKAAYDKAFAAYKTTSRTSDQATIESLVQETYDAGLDLSAAVKSATNLIQLYQDTLTAKNTSYPSTSSTQITTLGTYTSTMNTQISNLSNASNALKNAKQSLTSAQRSLTEAQESYDKTMAGADELDLRSAQLSVQQREDALADARDALANYTIRAPFDGTIAALELNRGDSVGSGTSVATIITAQQIAVLSLNEVDAAKIQVGDKATLTFDAIEDLSVTGKVASVDSLGTVSQGVVSYTVKIALDSQDARIKPGMTVNAAIQTDVATDVLAVPASAVKTQNGASYVLVFANPIDATSGESVDSPVAPTNAPVTIGISDDTYTEIRSGLTEGEQIVVRTTSSSASTAASATARTTNARGFGGAAPAGGIRL